MDSMKEDFGALGEPMTAIWGKIHINLGTELVIRQKDKNQK